MVTTHQALQHAVPRAGAARPAARRSAGATGAFVPPLPSLLVLSTILCGGWARLRL